MEYSKYDIFLQNIKDLARGNVFYQIHWMIDYLLISAILFLILQLFWEIKNQLKSDRFTSDFNSSKNNNKNFEIDEDTSLIDVDKNNTNTKKNELSCFTIELNPWINSDEISKTIEEKNKHISWFLKNYTISSSHINRKHCIGPSLCFGRSKSHTNWWVETIWGNSSNIELSNLLSTYNSERKSPFIKLNNFKDDNKAKKLKKS